LLGTSHRRSHFPFADLYAFFGTPDPVTRMARKSSTQSLSTRKKRKAFQMSKVVNLALQGGGSHGAFTWGVLDRLLEDERLSFEGISATSAGAVNAVVLADGLAAGGRDGARDALRVYWQKVSALSARLLWQR
jgi:NTE family protein